MENRKVKIDPIDEALKLTSIQNEVKNDQDSEGLTLLNIVNTEYTNVPSDEECERMIDKLYQKLSVDSLGVLITNTISRVSSVNIEKLSSETGLPVLTIEQLQSDRILANSVPVIQFRNLLRQLQIPFDKAERAIQKTFQVLKNEYILSPASLGHAKLSYRRKSVAVPSSMNVKSGHPESWYLFQNEEALQKYLKRLNDLYEP